MEIPDKIYVGESTTGTSTSTTWHCPYNPPKAEQGWECPRCGRINAPWKSQCDCVRNEWTITTSTDTFRIHPDSTVYQVGGSDYKEGNAYVNVSGTQSNKINPNTITTAWNNRPSTQTIHNGKINYKE